MVVTPPQNIAAPDVIGVVAQMDGLPVIYAHNYLSGASFDVQNGSVVRMVDNNYKVTMYRVISNDVYLARSTKIAAGGGDFDWAGNEWVSVSELIGSLPDGAILLFTCYSGSGNVVTGRRFVTLRALPEWIIQTAR